MAKQGKYQKFIPNEHQKSVQNIDFLNLYKMGFRALLIDIDNTLVSYKEHEPSEDLIAFIKRLESIGFKIVFISNNNQERVSVFTSKMNYPFICSARKPLKIGFRKALKAIDHQNRAEVVVIGDQIMTDILGGNRMGFYTILVEPILRKSDILPTRINRRMERFFLKKAKKHNKALYESRFKTYEKM